jgi:hypothetical protein
MKALRAPAARTSQRGGAGHWVSIFSEICGTVISQKSCCKCAAYTPRIINQLQKEHFRAAGEARRRVGVDPFPTTASGGGNQAMLTAAM